MASLLIDLLYIPLAVLYLPFLLYQMLVLKKNRRGWGQRFGFIRRRCDRRPCVWIHAVSLGEVNAARGLVRQIESRLPSYDIVLSATTDTGYAAAVKQHEPKQVFRYPLDFSLVVRRVMDRIRPDAIVLMELEVWPNLLAAARRRDIPMLIANGRITHERSMRRFSLPVVRPIARWMFRNITAVGAQNEVYADRFRRLGASPDRVVVTGSMKYDTALIADRVPGDDALAQAMGIRRERPLVVAGSTGPGEERMLLSAYRTLLSRLPGLQLAMVPRKPERFDEIARLIQSEGFACRRRSACADDAQGPSEQDRKDRPTVFLGDTMGELRKFYSLADVVFVGRSLVPMGGSDLMEVAGLAKAMCFGPYVENFQDVAERLLDANAAVRVNGEAELASALGRLLSEPETARTMGGAAQEVVRARRGATAKTVSLLCEALGRRGDDPEAGIATLRPPARSARPDGPGPASSVRPPQPS